MRFLNINGTPEFKNIEKYRIDWTKKSRSKVQFMVKAFLYPFWRKYVVYEEMPVYGTKMQVDIVNVSKKIAIEVQGKQHDDFNPFFHNNSRRTYFHNMQNDLKKREWLELNGFQVIEIYETEAPSLTVEFFKEKFNVILS